MITTFLFQEEEEEKEPAEKDDLVVTLEELVRYMKCLEINRLVTLLVNPTWGRVLKQKILLGCAANMGSKII